jgi:hypothetical protein
MSFTLDFVWYPYLLSLTDTTFIFQSTCRLPSRQNLRQQQGSIQRHPKVYSNLCWLSISCGYSTAPFSLGSLTDRCISSKSMRLQESNQHLQCYASLFAQLQSSCFFLCLFIASTALFSTISNRSWRPRSMIDPVLWNKPIISYPRNYNMHFLLSNGREDCKRVLIDVYNFITQQQVCIISLMLFICCV